MISNAEQGVVSFLKDTQGVLPDLERSSSLIQAGLRRNIAESLGLSGEATQEEIAGELGEMIAALGSREDLSLSAMNDLTARATLVSQAIKFAKDDTFAIPGSSLDTSGTAHGDIVFPNGRTLIRLNGCKTSQGSSPYIDIENAGIVNVPDRAITSTHTRLYTDEGRMFLPAKLDTSPYSSGDWAIVELSSKVSPQGNVFHIEGFDIRSFYGLYPLNDGRILACLEVEDSSVEGNKRLAVVNIFDSKEIEFEDSSVRLVGNFTYAPDGSLFAQVIREGAKREDIVVSRGGMYNLVGKTGYQVASIDKAEVLTNAYYCSKPYVVEDGSVCARIEEEKGSERVDLALSAARIPEDSAAAKTGLGNDRTYNFPRGYYRSAFSQEWHDLFKLQNGAQSSIIKLENAPEPIGALKLENINGAWTVVDSAGKGVRELIDFDRTKEYSSTIAYRYSNNGLQLGMLRLGGRSAIYEVFDLQTGRKFEVDGSLVKSISDIMVLPNGEEIASVDLGERGSFLYYPASNRIKGVSDEEIQFVDTKEAYSDKDGNLYVNVRCAKEFSDFRFMKV